MSDPMVMVVVGIIGATFLTILSVGFAAKRFYIVPAADEALVKTGGPRPVVSTGGGLVVVPLIHRVSRVSLQAIRIPIDRRGDEALPTSDKLMAEIVGELFVQVSPANDADILQAVQSIGTSEPAEMGERVRSKIDSLVTDALRTAAFKKSFLELNSQKKEFADEVIDLLQEDLAKLGLTLTAVSIPHIYQGRFTEDAGDVFAAEGRRNVAATVQKNREQTNRITREAEVKIQEQDVTARERALELDLLQRQKEADQARNIEEYEAHQSAETRKSVLGQEQATALAEATQIRTIREGRIAEAKKVETAQIAKDREINIQKSRASADAQVAAEEAIQQQRVAEVARQKAVEAAEIDKDRVLKVAAEQREEAITVAEVAKEIAVAQRREEEALARAKQADAEAGKRRSEEQVHTVEATARAERAREVATIKATEEADQERIAADRDAYTETKRAEAERDAATKRAQAVEAQAKGLAEAKKAEAEGYAADVAIRAEADFEAAGKQAAARKELAAAILEEGRAQAEARRMRVEAENAIATELLLRDVTLKALDVAPDVVRELMAPVANVAHDVKILQVTGLGDDEGVAGLPATILNTGLAAAGVAPFLKEAARAVVSNPDVQELTTTLTGVARSAVREAVGAATEGLNGVEIPASK